MSTWDAWGRDPDLARAGQAFRHELRAEAEEVERLAAKDRLRQRTLGDVAAELVQRGDRVAVAVGGRTFRGTVVHAAADLACLRCPGAQVDVHLVGPTALQVTERVRSGGQPRRTGAASFKARLCEHEAALAPVVLCCPALGLEVHGQVEAVAADHVLARDADDAEWFLALAAVAAVVVRTAR